MIQLISLGCNNQPKQNEENIIEENPEEVEVKNEMETIEIEEDPKEVEPKGEVEPKNQL